MAATGTLIFEGDYTRTSTGYTQTDRYLVNGATTKREASVASGVPTYNSALGASLPLSMMLAKSIKVSAVPDSKCAFHVDVTYQWEYSNSEDPTEPYDGLEMWEFSGAQKTTHVDTALSQDKFGTYARDTGLAVGVSDNGEIAGVDIPDSDLNLRVRLWKATADVTASYIAGCARVLIPRHVNSVNWYGFSPGECILDNINIPKSLEELTEITFDFLGVPNLSSSDLPDYTDIDGNTITVTDGKDGWDYLWTQTGRSKTGSSGSGDDTESCYTRGVYRARFFPKSNFSALGLSGSL